MRSRLASRHGLNRSEVCGTANEYVTLSLKSAVVAEIILLTLLNKHLRMNCHDRKTTTSPGVMITSKEKHSGVRNQQSCSNSCKQRNKKLTTNNARAAIAVSADVQEIKSFTHKG